jgi:sulfatase modifying factor 1
MGNNPSHFKGDNLPVESISWYDTIEFCNTLSKKEGLMPCYSGNGNTVTCNFSANGYRLPTEAEWEYAARGGKKSKGYTCAGNNTLNKVGWFFWNSDKRTHIFGEKIPNELGLYDMSGNVWEWCWDWREDYGFSPVYNPTGPSNGSIHVIRGGGWSDEWGNFCRVSYRGGRIPDIRSKAIGFRLVRKDK